jgi:hypothetical protein
MWIEMIILRQLQDEREAQAGCAPTAAALHIFLRGV